MEKLFLRFIVLTSRHLLRRRSTDVLGYSVVERVCCCRQPQPRTDRLLSSGSVGCILVTDCRVYSHRRLLTDVSRRWTARRRPLMLFDGPSTSDNGRQPLLVVDDARQQRRTGDNDCETVVNLNVGLRSDVRQCR